eukprot:TRINITY_DN8846_c0_g1_i2.p1 TRINITY_DN8846_c0_g1~~TRINITY_DN8846_c0_g1_i2.p1  ORF type:complete len:218 (-),score=26.11 TRINITY_DN8846_c0_g1_i2:663-1316(-)
MAKSNLVDGTVDVADIALRNKEDPYAKWLKQPRSLTVLFIGFSVLIYFAFTRSDNSDTFRNTQLGIGASAAVFLFYSMLQLKDGLFVRPHPMIWRLVKGASVLYLMFLAFLLFQSPDDTRMFFHNYIDEELGVKLPEKSYGEDCRIYTPENPESNFYNIKSTIFDEFIIAHFLGWFGKCMIFRDMYLSWFMSIWFEILELSLMHVLPNFIECWWDHV